MARVWSSGAELNSMTSNVEFTSATSTTVQSAVTKSGNYATQFNVAGEEVRFVFESTDQQGAYYARMYVYITDLPAAALSMLILGRTNLSALVSLQLQTDGTVKIRNIEDSADVGVASSALSLNQWYLLELKVDTTTLASTAVEGKIDGTAFTSGTINLANGIGSIRVGDPIGTATSFNYYIDDLAVNNSSGSFQNSYPGSGRIIHLKPNAAGDNSDWTNDYLNVDETTPDDASTLVSSNTLDQIDDHNIEAPPMHSSDTVNVVQVGVRFNGAGASANASFVLRIKASASGTVEESSAITPSNTTWVTNAAASPRNYSLTLYDLPGASTTAWTTSDLTSAQIGYRLSATSTNAAQISTVWLLVDYTDGSTFPVYDASSSTQGDTVSSLTFSHTCTGTNRLLVVVSAVEANATPANRPITGVTYNSVALTKADDELFTSGGGEDDAVEIWYLYGPATGANNVVVTYTGTVEGATAGAMSFTNAKQSGTPDVSSTSATSTGPATTSTTTTTDNCIVVAVAATMSSSRTLTPSQGFTGGQEVLDITNTGQNVMSAGFGQRGGQGAFTSAWTVDASADWLIVAAAFAPYVAAGGGGASTSFVFQTTNNFWGS